MCTREAACQNLVLCAAQCKQACAPEKGYCILCRGGLAVSTSRALTLYAASSTNTFAFVSHTITTMSITTMCKPNSSHAIHMRTLCAVIHANRAYSTCMSACEYCLHIRLMFHASRTSAICNVVMIRASRAYSTCTGTLFAYAMVLHSPCV